MPVKTEVESVIEMPNSIGMAIIDRSTLLS